MKRKNPRVATKIIIIKFVYSMACQFFWSNSYFNTKWPKLYTIPQWISIFVFKIISQNLSYRGTEDALLESKVSDVIWLKEIPHFSTINRNLKKFDFNLINDFIKFIFVSFILLSSFVFAMDTTWFEETNRSRYFEKRSWKERKNYIKLGVVVDVDSKLIVTWTVWKWPSSDVKYWEEMLEKIKEFWWIILADAWFDWWKNINDNTIIPPIRRWWNIKSAKRKKRKKEFEIFKNSWLYWYRRIVETVYSVMKRKFGSYIREKLDVTKRNILLLFCVAYNAMVI